MRILYYTTWRSVPTKGGTERTTVSMASALTRLYGYECHSAYLIDTPGPFEPCFVAETCVGPSLQDAVEGIVAYTREHAIDCVISQGEFNLVAGLREAGIPSGVVLMLAHHFEPGWEEHFGNFRSCMKSIANAETLRQKIKPSIRIAGYPAYRVMQLRHLHASYRAAYDAADVVVLLSQGFERQFCEYGRIDDASKFAFIPNPLSSERFLQADELAGKKKIALIVARLDEPPKKISLALEAWRRVKRDAASEGWELHIIGHGNDEAMYRRIVKRDSIPGVRFLGRGDPFAAGGGYCLASIFLMSSVSEGWGLTLTEAQQMGCVPVAFDSYASVREIVTDGKSGLLVPYADVAAYAEAVLSLMRDDALRERMALVAVEDARRYTQERVAAKWHALLQQTVEELPSA